ncbi:ribonuclease HI family protein [Patescibacteria group bacterium]|nr:ribonuclease HI family protein [Patescibacteria group bacterium]
MKLIIYTDGGARGNPGPSGLGVVIYNQDKQLLKKYSKFLNQGTNNQAEYQALILGLEKAKSLKASEVDCYLDSKLIVEQINGNYKIKNPGLGSLFIRVWNLSQSFKKVNFYHIPREKNQEADQLVNKAMDENIS